MMRSIMTAALIWVGGSTVYDLVVGAYWYALIQVPFLAWIFLTYKKSYNT